MRQSRRTLLLGLLLALLLIISGLSTLGSSGMALAAPAPSPTHTSTSTSTVHRIVYAHGRKYRADAVTTLRTWQLKNGQFTSDLHYTVKVYNRSEKLVYKRKVFDNNGWFELLGQWTLKQPHYKSLKALERAIVEAT